MKNVYPLILLALAGLVFGAAIIGNNHSVGDQLRVYRLAVAATAEFTEFHGGTKDEALAEIKAIVAKVNAIYERELAIRFELIPDAQQKKIIFTNAANDPYTPGDSNALLGENQATLDSLIGDADYDLGHVFGKAVTNGGGRALLRSVGRTGTKAMGTSEGITPASTSDDFIGVIVHEMGHQFGATHSFNVDATGACILNRDGNNAYEPGSGSTIMSYAGVCGVDDLQSSQDFYFHASSFEQINDFIENKAHAAPHAIANTSNSAPVIAINTEFVIPTGTPFELKAEATDAEGDPLTYTWEQLDLGEAMGLPLSDNGEGPLFRSFKPTPKDKRTFPRLPDLLANELDRGELLPTTERELNFRLSVRDNRPGGGGLSSQDIRIDVVKTDAPFQVTLPNGGETWTGGTRKGVRWDVAETDGAAIGASRVQIWLSTNGGLDFPFLLADTANDGRATIDVPNIDTTQARLKICGKGFIFFDISNENFTITSDSSAPGVTLTESHSDTEITEDGLIDGYTVQLNTPPSGTVSIDVEADDETEVSADGSTFGNTLSLQFDSTDPQTVYIRALDDDVTEGTHRGFVSHEIKASTSADYPEDLIINWAGATILDNDAYRVVGIDFDFSEHYPSPTDWKTVLMDSALANLTDLSFDDGTASPIDLELQYIGAASLGWSSAPASSGSKPKHYPALDDLDGYNASTATLIATWSDLIPGREYGISVLGLDGDPHKTYAQGIIIRGSTTLPAFTQNLVDNVLFVNDSQGSREHGLAHFDKVVPADESGVITVEMVPAGPDGMALAGLAIREITRSTPGLTFSPPAVAEGSSSQIYEVRLNSNPEGSVNLELRSDGQTELSLDGVNYGLTQTLELENTLLQEIHVKAVDDSVPEGLHLGYITHVVTSTTSQDYPVGMELPRGEIPIEDNDAFGPLLGIDFDGANPPTSPDNWNVGRLFSIPASLIWEDGTPSSITVQRSAFGGLQGGTSPLPNTIPSHTQPLDGVDYTMLHSGAFGQIYYWWRGLTPGREYHVYVFAASNFTNYLIDQTVTVAGGGNPVTFHQSTTTFRELWVNGEKGSSARSLESFAVKVPADANGQITVSLDPQSVSNAVISAMAIQEAPVVPKETPGVTIWQGDGLALEEDGGTDTYTVALDSVPSGPVEITVNADDQLEVSLNGSDFSSSLSFSRDSKSAQTVHVRAVDDTASEDDPHEGRLAHVISSTADPTDYPTSTTIPNIVATIGENDAEPSSVSIVATDQTASEPSGNALLTVALEAGDVAPAGGVRVNFTISGTATSGADFETLPNHVVIPAGSNEAEISVTVIDDDEEELPESLTIRLTSTNVSNITIAGAPVDQASVAILSDDQTSLQRFLSEIFDVDDLIDPSKESTLWGDGIDIDEDGLTTLQEFFHNLSPTTINDDPIRSATIEEGGREYLDFIFRRRKDHQGVEQIVEAANSLDSDDWQTLTAFIEIITEIDADTEEVCVRFDMTDATRGFLRLRIR